MGKKLTKNNKKKVPRNTKKKYRGGVVLQQEWFKTPEAFNEAKRLQDNINNNQIDPNEKGKYLLVFDKIMKDYIKPNFKTNEYVQAQQKQIERATYIYNLNDTPEKKKRSNGFCN